MSVKPHLWIQEEKYLGMNLSKDKAFSKHCKADF